MKIQKSEISGVLYTYTLIDCRMFATIDFKSIIYDNVMYTTVMLIFIFDTKPPCNLTKILYRSNHINVSHVFHHLFMTFYCCFILPLNPAVPI